jgi:hypothetical protein
MVALFFGNLRRVGQIEEIVLRERISIIQLKKMLMLLVVNILNDREVGRDITIKRKDNGQFREKKTIHPGKDPYPSKG